MALSLSDVPSTPPSVLALDTEGAIDRVSLAGDRWAATLPWDGPAIGLVQDLIHEADVVVMHNAPHDVTLLLANNIEIGKTVVFDTMVAHKMLNPWSDKGLGKAAPIYGPFAPWKGHPDPEWYSLMDAWVLIPMYTRMMNLLCERKMYPLFHREMSLLWRLGDYYRPAWHGNENTVTHATGS